MDSGDTYTVTVLTGTGDGTIRLDVLDDDTIIDAATNPLDGGFTTGEAYSVDRTNPDTIITFPVASGTYNDSAFDGGCSTAGGDICGTATDPVTGGVASGVASVKVVVRQNSSGDYWDGSSFGSATAVLLPATGTTIWSLAFPATNFPDEGDYTIVSIATDAVGNAHMLATSFTVTFNIDRTNPTSRSTRAPARPIRPTPARSSSRPSSVSRSTASTAPTSISPAPPARRPPS